MLALILVLLLLPSSPYSRQLRYKQRSMWPTPDTQLTMCWQPAHRLLYSGSVGGRVNAWDIEKREHKSCLEGHTDIVTQVGCYTSS